jgi:DNA-binding CsgD family transcriptional regulator
VINATELSALLFELYQGYHSEKSSGHWCARFLSLLVEQLRLQKASLIVIPPHDDDRGLIFTSSPDGDIALAQDILQTYADYYARDPLVNIPTGRLLTVDDLISRAEFEASDYYQAFLQPLGVHKVAGMDWCSDDGARCSLRLMRTKEQERFGSRERQFLTLLLPHLRQATAIANHLSCLASESRIYSDMVAKRAIGIVTLDDKGCVLKKNTAAEQYLSHMGSTALGKGRPRLGDHDACRRLERFIDEAISAARKNVNYSINALSVNTDQGSFQLLVKPLPQTRSPTWEAAPCVALLIQAPEHRFDISVRTLMNLYGLTLTEATVATIMSEGHTSEEVAQEMNIKKNTVRAHIRSLFAKLGVSRQSMLVSVVLNSLATT